MRTCDKSLMKQQFSLTQTVRQSEIHTLLHTAVLQTQLLSKCCVHKKMLRFWSIEEVSFILFPVKFCIYGSL